MDLEEIDRLCFLKLEEYSEFVSEKKFGNLIWSTYDSLDRSLLNLKNKVEFENYFQLILDKVEQSEHINEYQVKRMLLALKLKFIRYLNIQ
jgi:hypothetical protein